MALNGQLAQNAKLGFGIGIGLVLLGLVLSLVTGLLRKA